MIAAIIPAAGRSSRMGSPKAVLRLGETTFLGAILEAARRVGLDPRIVVLAEGDDKPLQGIDLGDVTVTRTHNLAAGPIGSIQAALAAVANQPVEAALVWHVDRPHVRAATVAKLVRRFRRGDCPIVVPSYGGRRGHPVIFGRAVFGELLQVPSGEGARAVVRRSADRVAVVPVDDPAVLESIDTREAYEALRRKAGPERT